MKMRHPVRDDQLQVFSVRFDELFGKRQGLGNVCFLHGVLTPNGWLCIAMRFYEGSIGDRMTRIKGGGLPLSDVLRFGADLPHGVLELHSRGIFVQNLQPCNFLLDNKMTMPCWGILGFHPCCLNFRCQIQTLSKDLGLQIPCPRTVATKHQRPN